MNIRIATIEDLDVVLKLASKFAENSPYAKYIDEDTLKSLIQALMAAPNSVILLYEDVGMLAAMATKFPFGEHFTATEIAWWVEPDSRGKKVGAELLEAYEYWAHKVGCSLVTVASLDDDVGKFYEKKGYALKERAYVKEI